MTYRKRSTSSRLALLITIAAFLTGLIVSRGQAQQGFAGPPVPSVMQIGEELLRFGRESGNYLTRIPPPPGLPRPTLRTLSLGPPSPYGRSLDLTRRYRVLRPFPVLEGTAAPYPGLPGGANQIFTLRPVEELVAEGQPGGPYLEELRPGAPARVPPSGPARLTGAAAQPLPVEDFAVTAGAIGIPIAGILAKKHDSLSAPEGLQVFPPNTPSGEKLASSTPVPATFSVNGTQSFTAGGSLGYNVQFGNLVIGIEGDAAWKKLSASNSATFTSTAVYEPLGAPAQRTELFSGQVGQNWDAFLRARLGAFITPAIQTYVAGGAAFGDVNGAFSYSGRMNLCNGPPPTFTCVTPADFATGSVTQTTTGSGSWSQTRVGWTIGSGIDFDVGWGGWKVRLEYDYTNFGSFTHNVPLTRTCSQIGNPGVCGGPGLQPGFGVVPNTGPASATVTQQAAFQTVRIGLVYTFNGFEIGGFAGYSGD
jgi:opacity protein-like surface antigen